MIDCMIKFINQKKTVSLIYYSYLINAAKKEQTNQRQKAVWSEGLIL